MRLLGGPRQEQESPPAHYNSPVECSLAADMGFLFRTCQGTAGAGENSSLKALATSSVIECAGCPHEGGGRAGS